MPFIVGIITWIATSLLPRLIPFLGSIAVQILLMLGFSLVAVEGINVGFDYFVNMIDSNMNGIPSDILGVMGLLGVDEAINVILTAHLFVIGLKGLSARKLIPSWRGSK